MSHGMFVDGLTYASIARNLALNGESLWQLHYTNTVGNAFYGHLPLAIWLQSLCFQVFGDSILIERLYGLILYVFTGGVIIGIWKELTGNLSNGWLPLLFWISIPEVSWACQNNVLENTMTLFTGLTMLAYLKYSHSEKTWQLMLCGLFLLCAFWSKGPTALYLLFIPFIFTSKEINWNLKKSVWRSFVLLLFILIPLLLMINFVPEGRRYLSNYYHDQLLCSLSSTQTVAHRFQILIDFTTQIIPAIIIVILSFVFYSKRELLNFIKLEYLYSPSQLFLLTLAGVFPIMISLKQSSFYILSVYPFLAIGFALLTQAIISNTTNTDFARWRRLRYKIIITILILAGGLIWNILQIGKTGRDHDKVELAIEVSAYLQHNQTIGLDPELFEDWALHGYFARYGNISLDPDPHGDYKYILTCTNCSIDNYKNQNLIPVITSSTYILFEKMPNE